MHRTNIFSDNKIKIAMQEYKIISVIFILMIKSRLLHHYNIVQDKWDTEKYTCDLFSRGYLPVKCNCFSLQQQVEEKVSQVRIFIFCIVFPAVISVLTNLNLMHMK